MSLSKKEQYVIIEKMDIHNVAQLISMCHIFISSDSGLMHIASAMGVPTVAVFGPTNPVFVRPWGVPYDDGHGLAWNAVHVLSSQRSGH